MRKSGGFASALKRKSGPPRKGGSYTCTTFCLVAGWESLVAGRWGTGYNFLNGNPLCRVCGLKVLFFGRLRELTGLAEETGELPEGATLAQVV